MKKIGANTFYLFFTFLIILNITYFYYKKSKNQQLLINITMEKYADDKELVHVLKNQLYKAYKHCGMKTSLGDGLYFYLNTSSCHECNLKTIRELEKVKKRISGDIIVLTNYRDVDSLIKDNLMTDLNYVFDDRYLNIFEDEQNSVVFQIKGKKIIRYLSLYKKNIKILEEFLDKYI